MAHTIPSLIQFFLTFLAVASSNTHYLFYYYLDGGNGMASETFKQKVMSAKIVKVFYYFCNSTLNDCSFLLHLKVN